MRTPNVRVLSMLRPQLWVAIAFSSIPKESGEGRIGPTGPIKL